MLFIHNILKIKAVNSQSSSEQNETKKREIPQILLKIWNSEKK